MADVVVVGVLEAKVVLLDDVHLVVHLLHQLLPRRFLLQRKQMSIQVTNKSLKKVRRDEIDHEVKGEEVVVGGKKDEHEGEKEAELWMNYEEQVGVLERRRVMKSSLQVDGKKEDRRCQESVRLEVSVRSHFPCQAGSA